MNIIYDKVISTVGVGVSGVSALVGAVTLGDLAAIAGIISTAIISILAVLRARDENQLSLERLATEKIRRRSAELQLNKIMKSIS